MDTFAAKTESAEVFAKRFEALTGNTPFPWQECLFLRLLSGNLPPADVGLPTGTGKTSIMGIWLLALAEMSSVDSRQNLIPRRLVWVVNRRVVVDQATIEVEQIRRRVNDPAIVELEPIRSTLRKLSGKTSGEIFGISTLRGQFEDNTEWRGDPSRPAVIVGTVDMIGSRLLFSGYGVGFKARPLHAGFLGQDVLLVHDEAHLEPAFQELLIAIREEQKRCGEFGKLHVMALSASSRAANGTFGLTEVEKDVPNEIPDPPETSLHIIWRRQGAKKTISLQKDAGNLATSIAEDALKFKDQRCAALVFAQRVEDVEKIVKKLPKDSVQQLTGTMRGFERDRLVTKDAVFQRFLPGAKNDGATVYLVCTSAGEVGINISADHLICDLSPFDSMVQRFGRVNRFGDRDDTKIHIFYPEDFDQGEKSDPSQQAAKKESELDKRRKATLKLLRQLDGDGSPRALGALDSKECLAAFTPEPVILPATDILFDSWALTTIRGKLPGRPPVEPYLHGVSDELPETHVAWRDEVKVISGKLLEQYDPEDLEDLLDAYPLKPHELMRDRSDRVLKALKELAAQHPETPVWLLTGDGSVEPLTLEKLVSDKETDRIDHKTVLLSPAAGGLNKSGLLDGSAEKIDDVKYDVADEWPDAGETQRRIRLWDDAPNRSEKIDTMRLILEIDTNLESDDDLDTDEVTIHRYWRWYERPRVADNDGSERDTGAVLWQVHTDDVVREASRIVDSLPLSDELRKAVVVAAHFHDYGKRRPPFQRNIGNVDADILLAKSGRKKQPYTLSPNFRHEFASLLDLQNEPEFLALDRGMRELVLHLVAVHHGRGRPHFPSKEAYDPEAADEKNFTVAAEVPPRFARLQRKYGRWGLAYLESLLRAADYAASTNPSKFWEGKQ